MYASGMINLPSLLRDAAQRPTTYILDMRHLCKMVVIKRVSSFKFLGRLLRCDWRAHTGGGWTMSTAVHIEACEKSTETPDFLDKPMLLPFHPVLSLLCLCVCLLD